MNGPEIKIIHKCIKKFGDSFWIEPDNEYLFDDILKAINKTGYDFQLIACYLWTSL